MPDRIITTSGEIREPVKNTVVIKAGAQVTAHARVSGTVIVEDGASLDAHTPVGGTVHVQVAGMLCFAALWEEPFTSAQGGRATMRPLI